MSASMNTILIIGGTSGIGENFVKRFHKMGKDLIVTGRRANKLQEMEKELPGLKIYTMNMTDFGSTAKDVETLFSRYPNIDTVWINGGLQYASSPKDASSTTDAKIEDEVTLNVTAPMILGRHIIPQLLKKDGETNFMITGSGLGFLPAGGLFSVYCATKAAVHSYCVGIRQALKDTNVNVLELVPPYVGGTELGAEHADKLAGVKPMPMEDFTNDVFKILEENEAKDLKEIAAGTAQPRVDAWRKGTGEMLVSSGMGG
jgi:uncharacterized oxidoreductase